MGHTWFTIEAETGCTLGNGVMIALNVGTLSM